MHKKMLEARAMTSNGSTLAPVLPNKRQRFVDEYLIDMNGTKAAIRAGYAETSAAQIASKLLRIDNVKAALAFKQAKLAEQSQMTPEGVAAELARIGYATVEDFFTVNPETGKPEIDLRNVSSDKFRGLLEVTPDKVKLDKRGALMDLAKLLGWLNETVEISGPNGTPIAVDVREYTAIEVAQRLAGIIARSREGEPLQIDSGGRGGDAMATPSRPREPTDTDPPEPSL